MEPGRNIHERLAYLIMVVVVVFVVYDRVTKKKPFEAISGNNLGQSSRDSAVRDSNQVPADLKKKVEIPIKNTPKIVIDKQVPVDLKKKVPAKP